MVLAFLVKENRHMTHSQNIHQGITILISSILLVILIIGFIYRGGLNHAKNKTIERLSIFWLIT